MTSVREQFIDKKNKELLWNVLLENGVFNGIDSKNFTKVQETFELSINNVSANFKNSYDLVSANKMILSTMVEKLKIFKNSIPELSNPISVSKPSENISEVTNNHFNEKQKEFTDLIKLKPPDKVEFTNVEDEPMQEDQLDSILEETIRQRKLDLENIVLKDQNKRGKKVEIIEHIEEKKDSTNVKKEVKWAENIETNIDDLKEQPATSLNSNANILSRFKIKNNDENNDITVIKKIDILESKINEISKVFQNIVINIFMLMNIDNYNSNNDLNFKNNNNVDNNVDNIHVYDDISPTFEK